MVRVTFVVAPFKKRFIDAMIHEFSLAIVSQVISPPELRRQGSIPYKAATQLIGDPKLRKAITQFDPDIVYSDDALYASQLMAFSLFNKRRKPLILHLNGDLWREYWAWFMHEHRWSRRLRSLMVQHSYLWASVAFATKVTPICRWLEKVVHAHVPWTHSEVVYQGIDPTQFYEEEGMEFRHPAVAIIQNHTIYPKVEALLRFREVIKSLPEVNFYVAEGEATGSSLLPMVKSHYANMRNVEFVSGVDSRSAVRRMLTASDCYLLATGLDCCPTTVLEASLMRRPVIASRVGGVPEIVLENESGWTVANEAVIEWISKIRLVLSDGRIRRKMGEQGRAWVATRFNWNTIAAQVERILVEASMA